MNDLTNIIKKLKKSLISYFQVSSSLLISRILGGLVTILISRILGSSQFAIFSAGFFILTILGRSTTGIDKSYVFQFVIAKSEEKDIILSSYTYLKFSLWFIFMLLSLIFTGIFKERFEFSYVIFLTGSLFSLSYILLTYVTSIYQSQKNFKYFGITNIIFNSSLFIFVLVLYLLNVKNIYIYISLYFLASLVMLFIILPKTKQKLQISINNLKNLLNKSKWLLLAEICWLIFIRLDYFNLSNTLSKNVLGNYALALRSMNIVLIFISSLSFYILPKTAEISNSSQLKKFWKINILIAGSLIFLCFILFITSDYFFPLIFGKEYSTAPKYFKMMIIAYLPNIIIPPFKYLILKIKKEFLYFVFNIILIGIYIISLQLMLSIFKSYGPIAAKGLSFLIALIFGILIYLSNKKKILQ